MFQSYRLHVRRVCAIRGHRGIGGLLLCYRGGAGFLFVSFVLSYFLNGTRFFHGQVETVKICKSDQFKYGT